MTKQVISFHYTLTDKTGKTHDTSRGTSRGNEPLTFLQGSGQIIPGLETALISLEKGSKKNITVPYAEAYGSYDQALIYEVPRNKFPNKQIQVGDMFQIEKDTHDQVVTVIEISEERVVLDANHPLAGKDLTFAVEIMDIRPATPQEMSHGHVHGHGGHHH